MFEFIIGIIIGAFVGFTMFSAIILTDINLDTSAATNIVIAFATLTATAIHYSSVKQQRKDRLWDINKTILLELRYALAKVIAASEFYLQKEYAKHHLDDSPIESDKPSANVFNEFKEKQEHVLTVYKLLISKELIRALAEAKKTSEFIDLGYFDHEISVIEAYEKSISTYKNLEQKLDYFIAEMSGVINQ